MDIQFKVTHYEPAPELIDLATRKITMLGKKFLGDMHEIARAYVEFGKAVGSHHTGRIWRAEINLDAEGMHFRVEAVREKMEDALSKAIEELARELRTAKKKETSMLRRGGAAMKSLLRGFRK